MPPERLSSLSRSTRSVTAALTVLCIVLLATAGWSQEPLIEIVPPTKLTGSKTIIRTLVTSRDIRQVDFLIDGRPVGTDRRFPFSLEIAARAREGARRLEVVALDLEGRELDRDELRLDPAPTDLGILISKIQSLGSTDWLEVTAEVRHSPTTSIERVDFYRGDHFAASTTRQPFRAVILNEEGSYLRAVVHLRGGDWAEGVRLLSSLGVADEVAVNLVQLYAMVSNRRGTPVIGLTQSDFLVTRADRPVPLERFSIGDEVPLSLALVIDASGSMQKILGKAKAAARLFLEKALDQGDEALLIDFALRPRLLQQRTGDVDELIAHFSDIESRGGSSIHDAIVFGLIQLQASSGRRALIVLTDGLDSSSQVLPEDCIALARLSGVPIFALTMGGKLGNRPSHRTHALRRMTERTGGRVYEISDVQEIHEAYREINLQLRGQYLLSFAAETMLSPAELDELDVQMVQRRLVVRFILGGQLQLSD